MTDPFTESMNEITLASATNGERVPVVAVLKAMMALNESLSGKIEALTAASVEAMETHCKDKMHMTCGEFDSFVKDRKELLAQATNQARRADDPEGATFHEARRPRDAYTEELSDERSKKYTREQVVTTIILAIVVVAMNSGVTWLIIRALEEAS